MLTYQLSTLLPSAGGQFNLGAARDLPPAVRAAMHPALGEAFSHTFLYSFAISALTFVAALFLPRKKPQAAAEPEATLQNNRNKEARALTPARDLR